MSRSIVGLAAALMLGGLGAVPAAHAAPLPVGSAPGAAPTFETVAFGCGPGWTRGPYGRCRPMGGPRFYGRRCFVQRTPFGPRRVCR